MSMKEIPVLLSAIFTVVFSQHPSLNSWSIDKEPSKEVNGITFFHSPMTSSSDDKTTTTEEPREYKLNTFWHFMPDQKRLSKTVGLSQGLNQVLHNTAAAAREKPGAIDMDKTSTSSRLFGSDKMPTLYTPMNIPKKQATVNKHSMVAIGADDMLANYGPVGDTTLPVASEIIDFSTINNDIGNVGNVGTSGQIRMNNAETTNDMQSMNYAFSDLGLAGSKNGAGTMNTMKDSSFVPFDNLNTDLNNVGNSAMVNDMQPIPFGQLNTNLNTGQNNFGSTVKNNDVKAITFGQLNNKREKFSKSGPVFSTKKEFTDHSRKPMLLVKSAFVDMSGRQNPNMKAVSGFVDRSDDDMFQRKQPATTTPRTTTATTAIRKLSTTPSPLPTTRVALGGKDLSRMGSNNVMKSTNYPNTNSQGSGGNPNLKVDILYPPAPFPGQSNPIRNQNTNDVNQSGFERVNNMVNKDTLDMNTGTIDNMVDLSANGKNTGDMGLVDYDIYSEVDNGMMYPMETANQNQDNLNSPLGNSVAKSNSVVPLNPASDNNVDIFRTETNVQIINPNFQNSNNDQANKRNQASEQNVSPNQMTTGNVAVTNNQQPGQITNQNWNNQGVRDQSKLLQTQSNDNIGTINMLQNGVGTLSNPELDSVNKFQNQGSQLTNTQNQNTPSSTRLNNIPNSNVPINPSETRNQMPSVNNNSPGSRVVVGGTNSQAEGVLNQWQSTTGNNNNNQMITNVGPGISTIVGVTGNQSNQGLQQNLAPPQGQMPSLTNAPSTIPSNTFAPNQAPGRQFNGQQNIVPSSNIPTGQLQSGIGINQISATTVNNGNILAANPNGLLGAENNAGINSNGFNGQSKTNINSQQLPSILNNNINNNNFPANNQVISNNMNVMSSNNNNLPTSLGNGNSVTNLNQQAGIAGRNNNFGNSAQNGQSSQNLQAQQNNIRNSANTGNVIPDGQNGLNNFGNIQNGAQNGLFNQNTQTQPNNMRNSANMGNIVPNGQTNMPTNIAGNSANRNTIPNGQMTNLQQNSNPTGMLGNVGNTQRVFNNNNNQPTRQFGQINNAQRIQNPLTPSNLGNGMNTVRNGQNTNNFNVPINSNQFNNMGFPIVRGNAPQGRINAGPQNPFGDPGLFNGPNIRPNFIPNNVLNMPRQNPFLSSIPQLNVNQIQRNSFNGGPFMPFR